MNEIMREHGVHLKATRRRAGLSLQAAATVLEITQHKLALAELGRGSMSPGRLAERLTQHLQSMEVTNDQARA